MSKLLPFLATVVVISPMPATSSAADLIVGGTDTLTLTIDTQVAGDVIVQDSGILTVNGVILEVDGDVWLEDTGRLVLQNQATLTLNLEFDEEHHVDISGNARLEVDNSLINSTGGQFWFELSDDSGGIPTLQVSGADSWLTNHSGIRPYDQAQVIVTGGDVEELQARDQVIVTVDHAATYPVYFFDGVTANLQSLWTDTDFTIGNTVSDGNWSFQITEGWVEGYQIDLKHGADVTIDDSDGIVLSLHTTGFLGDELKIVEGLTSASRTDGSTSNLGSSFAFTDSNIALINVYTFGSDRVLLRDLHVNEVNAEQTSELIVGQKGYATVLNCNLCQVYDRAIFRVIGSTSGPTTIIDASENLPSATSASGSFDPVGRGVMRFVDMDLANLDLTAREEGTLELIGCTNAVVQNLDPGTTTVVETDFDAAFAASVLSGNPPLDVGFFDHSGGDITTFAWTFGDGGSSSQQEPSYPYTSEGKYTVVLTTIGPGQSDSQTRTEYIQVGMAIFADGFESGDTGARQ